MIALGVLLFIVIIGLVLVTIGRRMPDIDP